MCTITQDDLGPAFEAVDADVADDVITTATSIVLGPSGTQSTTLVRWTRCGVDACLAIKLLAKHLLVTTPGTGATEGQATTSESIGGVSVSYANGGQASSKYGSTVHGQMYEQLQDKFDRCSRARRSFPIAIGPS
jgi:hypothetical protein